MFALNEFFLGLFYLPCISRHPYLLVNCTSRKTNRKFVSGKLAIKFAGSLTVAHSTSMLTPPDVAAKYPRTRCLFFSTGTQFSFAAREFPALVDF